MGRPKGSKNKKPGKVNNCHPELPHYSNYLCQTCYQRGQNAKRDKTRRSADMKEYLLRNKPEINAKQRARYRKNREIELRKKAEIYIKDRVLINARRKGLTKEQIARIPPRPEVCPKCGRGGRMVMDHCHAQVIFRSWLCHKCNVILGLASDDSSLLRKLADYLDMHKTTNEETEN